MSDRSHLRAADPSVRRGSTAGRHRRPKAGVRALGLPIVPTVGVVAVVLLTGGSTAAAHGHDSPGATGTGSASVSADAQRSAAAARADRNRQITADTKARARWTAKTVAAQHRLAAEVGSSVVTSAEVKLSAKTVAQNKRNAAAKKAAEVKYVLPVSSGVDRDTFGMTGIHWASRHTGQDFPVPMGTGVRAVSSGSVIETGWAGAFGNRMKLLLDDGTEIWYCHLSSYVVTSGRVSAGEVVALSGSTGNSTGPHLHMEVHLHQNPVASDPLDWLRSKGLKV